MLFSPPAPCRAVRGRFPQPLAARDRAQLIHCSDGAHAAGVDHGDAVAQVLGLFHDVSRVDDAAAGGPRLHDEFLDAARRWHVEARGRLVQDEDGRIVQDGAGDGRLLLHAGGQLVSSRVGERCYSESRNHLVGTLAQAGGIHAVQTAEKRENLARRQASVEASLARKKADLFAHLLGLSHNIEAAERGRTGRRFEQGRNDAQRGGFAGAVRPQKAEHLAAVTSKLTSLTA